MANTESETNILTGVSSTGTSTHSRALVGAVTGEVSASDLIMPYLGIAQSVGGLGDMFKPGHVILNKETDLTAAAPELEVTVLGAKKQFVEDIAYGTGEMPRYCDTEDEVRAMGGTLEWRDGIKPSFMPMLQAQVLIRIPDGVEGAFPLEFKGQAYSLALWSIRKTAYRSAGRSILTAAASPAFAGGIHHGKWDLTVSKQKFGRNTVFVPNMRLVGKHDPEFVEFAAGLLG